MSNTPRQFRRGSGSPYPEQGPRSTKFDPPERTIDGVLAELAATEVELHKARTRAQSLESLIGECRGALEEVRAYAEKHLLGHVQRQVLTRATLDTSTLTSEDTG